MWTKRGMYSEGHISRLSCTVQCTRTHAHKCTGGGRSYNHILPGCGPIGSRAAGAIPLSLTHTTLAHTPHPCHLSVRYELNSTL